MEWWQIVAMIYGIPGVIFWAARWVNKLFFDSSWRSDPEVVGFLNLVGRPLGIILFMLATLVLFLVLWPPIALKKWLKHRKALRGPVIEAESP